MNLNKLGRCILCGFDSRNSDIVMMQHLKKVHGLCCDESIFLNKIQPNYFTGQYIKIDSSKIGSINPLEIGEPSEADYFNSLNKLKAILDNAKEINLNMERLICEYLDRNMLDKWIEPFKTLALKLLASYLN